MVQVRLFGPARSTFGAHLVELDAAVLDEVLGALRARGGPEFVALLERSQLWVNGAPAEGDQRLESGDEVVVVPPVSGGQ